MPALTANPTNSRLKYVWDKQKPQIHPEVMLGLIEAVAERIMPGRTPTTTPPSWASRIETAAKTADRKFAATFIKWEWRDHPVHSAPYSVIESVSGAGEVDVPFVDAVLAMTVEMPEFRKAAPIDGLIPWFAKTLNDIYASGHLRKRDEWDPDDNDEYVNEEEDESWRVDAPGFRKMYARVLGTLASDPSIIEWFEKKKPSLSKLDVDDLFKGIAAFEEDREPEVVYPPEGKKTRGWDGWEVVQLKTKTQIQSVGEELDNCMKKGSSYTEGFCEAAKTGKSAFYALREDGKPVLSIQWSPGQTDPEQVYGPNNSEPEGDAEEKVSEWIESRGGKRRRWSRLSASAREIAEYIEQHGHAEDDDAIESYASDWDDAFSVSEAKAWLDMVGAYSLDMARAMNDAKLDPEEFKKLPEEVREYLFDDFDSLDEDDVKEAVLLGLLAGEMEGREGNRESNKPKERKGPARDEEGSRIQTEFSRDLQFYGEFPPEERHVGAHLFGYDDASVAERERREEEANTEIAKTIPWGRGKSRKGHWSRKTSPVSPLIIEAKRWYEAGWTDRDYFDDAAEWWAHWFSPEDAAIYFFDLAGITPSERGVEVEAADELRERGITAQDVLDASRDIAPKGVSGKDAEPIIRAVEKYRLTANKRRRISRRPPQPRRKRRTSRR